MTRTEGNVGKLVRDKVPDLIRASGRTPHFSTLSPSVYRQALIDKLHEEVAELAVAQSREALLEEAADVLEVLAAIAVDHGATLETVGELARLKRKQRGGFAMRLWLDAVDPAPREVSPGASIDARRSLVPEEYGTGVGARNKPLGFNAFRIVQLVGTAA